MSVVRFWMLAAAAALVSAGCGGNAGPVPAGLGRTPFVQQKGAGKKFVQFFPKTASDAPYSYAGLIAGPASSKDVWFQDMLGNGIVQMAQNGTIKEFTVAGNESGAGPGMALGADGRFYFGSQNNFVGQVDVVTQTGTGTDYPDTVDTPSGGFVLGPDGNVWFTEYNNIGKITPSGIITHYPFPTSRAFADPGDITAGADGNIWFTLGYSSYGSFLGKVVPSTGVVTLFDLRALTGCSFDDALTSGGDGNLWVDCGTQIVRFNPVTSAATPFSPPSNAYGGEVSGDMTAGPGETIWYGGAVDSGALVKYDIGTNTFTSYTPPNNANYPRNVLVDGDGNVWFVAEWYEKPNTGTQMEIAVYVTNPLRVTPNSVTLSAAGTQQTLTVAETGTSSWTASSSKKAVATVAPGGSANQFVVTAVSAGTANVTIADGVGNTVAVKVTVQ